MLKLSAALVLAFVCYTALVCISTNGFRPTGGVRRLANTQIHENFKLDFDKPEIVSDPRIFTEKQLREFTAEYSVDERLNPLEFLLNLFKKDEDATSTKAASAESNSSSSIAKNLKSTISLELLQERTGKYVQGKIDAASFYSTLTAAFGQKLPTVLPEILATLPKDKSAALSKVAN